MQVYVGNKIKGRISKRVFHENKARQIFRKTNISYPLIRTRTCAYQGVRNVRFSENLACFVFFETPVLRFALSLYYWLYVMLMITNSIEPRMGKLILDQLIVTNFRISQWTSGQLLFQTVFGKWLFGTLFLDSRFKNHPDSVILQKC